MADYAINSGTREYNYAAATRTAVGAASSAAIPIGALGASREVRFISSTRCFIKFGLAGMPEVAATDRDALALPADTLWHERIPVNVTHFRVIRDSADGWVRCTPAVW